MPKKSSKGVKKSAESLYDLLIQKMAALYDIEQQLVKALPKMADAATDEELKEGFVEHLSETEGHVTRLEQAFALLDLEPETLEVDAIRGLVKDAEWVIKNTKLPAVLDACLIASASYVEHYEIAGYTSAVEWATTLGETEVGVLLQETLAEEQNSADTLFNLGSTRINEQAMGDESEDVVEE